MDWGDIELDWDRVAAYLQSKWPGLTDADLRGVGRDRRSLLDRVHERTGLHRDTIERKLDALIAEIPPAPVVADAPFQGPIREPAGVTRPPV
jgi:hypothetical protein